MGGMLGMLGEAMQMGVACCTGRAEGLVNLIDERMVLQAAQLRGRRLKEGWKGAREMLGRRGQRMAPVTDLRKRAVGLVDPQNG